MKQFEKRMPVFREISYRQNEISELRISVEECWIRENEYCAYCSLRRFYSRTRTSNISAG